MHPVVSRVYYDVGNFKERKNVAGIAGLEPAVQESKSCALTDLAIPLDMVERERLELSNPEGADLQSAVITNYTTSPNMVGNVGLEPTRLRTRI